MNKTNIKIIIYALLNELYIKSNNEHIKPYEISKKYRLDERQTRILNSFNIKFKKSIENKENQLTLYKKGAIIFV